MFSTSERGFFSPLSFLILTGYSSGVIKASTQGPHHTEETVSRGRGCTRQAGGAALILLTQDKHFLARRVTPAARSHYSPVREKSLDEAGFPQPDFGGEKGKLPTKGHQGFVRSAAPVQRHQLGLNPGTSPSSPAHLRDFKAP